MTTQIIWQQDSKNLDNASNLGKISQWWQDLNLKEIFWQQRLKGDRDNLGAINWEPQQFDERYIIQMPQMRGITLYWYKSSFKDERSITPQKLILDPNKEQLYIYPQSQPELVIGISKTPIVYQQIELKDPLIVAKTLGSDYVLLFRDKQQQIEVKITVKSDDFKQILPNLS